jgi:sterol desaturase/sphingolipid hydroxylase (fatty acid hydroxylase superfamily)
VTGFERILLVFSLLSLLGAVIEGVVLTRARGYDWKAAGISVLDVAFRVAVKNLIPVSIATIVLRAAAKHQLFEISMSGWPSWALLFIGVEFFYYWMHRANHRIRWFWCNHAVHHAPTELNLSVSFRVGALERVTGNVLFYAPLVLLGFPTEPVFALVSLNLLYQNWIHATWIPKLGWLEYVFNTPSAHRVHHATNLEYLDANYGGVLIIFDRLFGTYRAERAEAPCSYGLVKPTSRYNPLAVEFQQWWWLARDIVRAGSLRGLLAIVMPPGWAPDGKGETTEDLRREALRDGPVGEANQANQLVPKRGSLDVVASVSTVAKNHWSPFSSVHWPVRYRGGHRG